MVRVSLYIGSKTEVFWGNKMGLEQFGFNIIKKTNSKCCKILTNKINIFRRNGSVMFHN